jgi:CO dehydrogenase nickel-insertion accessory protein CooC1
LENLSRRIVQHTALLVLVSDASNAGLNTLLRLYELAAEMKLTYGKLALVINKLRVNEDGAAKLPDRIMEIREKTKADIALGLSDDPEIASLSENSGCLLGISDNNAVYRAIGKMAAELISS